MLTAENQFLINFTRPNTKFCLSLNYKGRNSFLFVNGTKIYQFKAKDSEIKYPCCLENISKDLSVDNMKKTGLSGYVHDFSVDHNAIQASDIVEIHKYIMKNNNMVFR